MASDLSDLLSGKGGNAQVVSEEKRDESITVAQFLEEVPPNQTRTISNLGARENIEKGGEAIRTCFGGLSCNCIARMNPATAFASSDAFLSNKC